MRIEIEPRFGVHFQQFGEQRIIVKRVDARPDSVKTVRELSGAGPCITLGIALRETAWRISYRDRHGTPKFSDDASDGRSGPAHLQDASTAKPMMMRASDEHTDCGQSTFAGETGPKGQPPDPNLGPTTSDPNVRATATVSPAAIPREHLFLRVWPRMMIGVMFVVEVAWIVFLVHSSIALVRFLL